jgi:hypothetical protein
MALRRSRDLAISRYPPTSFRACHLVKIALI